MALLSGAQIVWECLRRQGVEVVFGYPGGCNLPIYDAMRDYPVRHVLVRHEQNGGHAADGYARASGKVGVAMGTSGPGATNLVTAIATAMLDSIPVVFITGQVPSGLIGSDAFQETDVTGVTLPITKHNALVMRVQDIAPAICDAFHIARSGRPGPVLVDIPKDVQLRTMEFVYSGAEPVHLSRLRPAESQAARIAKAIEMIDAAERPVILAGHGVLISGATDELRALAEKADIPVALTLLGLDALPPDHPQRLAMMGMHGEAYVNTAIQESDLLLALGMRFDDRVTGDLRSYARKAKKVHIDIDPAELGKNVPVDVAVHSDLRPALRALAGGVRARRREPWHVQIAAWRADSRRRDILSQPAGDRLYAAHVMDDLSRETGGEAIVATDVGQHQMWAAQYYRPRAPNRFITSGGLGTMGFGLPAAMGAKLARPESEVWAIVGDGGFQMSIPELGTLAQEKIAVKIAVINNGYLGMVRQWQELFYEKRYAATPLLNPDFVKLAEAYGIPGLRASRRAEVLPALRRARETDGPALIDFRVEKEDIVYPMVPAGTDLGTMIRRPLPAATESEA